MTAPFSKIVILGETGYIGSRLARAFRARSGAPPVVGRSAPALDLTRDASSTELQEILDADCAVIVCAAIKKQLGDNADVFARNMSIVLNVCRALANRPVKRVVFFSSAAVYGEDVQHGVITESTPVQPTSFYGIGKYAAERLLLRIVGQQPGASVLILRPTLIYGPDEPAYYYGPSGFLRMALAQSPITLWGDGLELREFLFIDDVVELTTTLALGGETGVLNVVSGTSYTYAHALKVISTLTGREPLVTSRPRTKDQVDHRFDATRLYRACPGFAFTAMEEGLRRIASTRGEALDDGELRDGVATEAARS